MCKKSVIVTDIGYGDAGKGTTVDYLVRQATSAVVVRHNGGSQAAHNVVTPDGRHHTFAQFGSGSFVPGVQTYLSRYMLVNPLNMLLEAEHLAALGVTDIWQRTCVDEGAPIILPWHQAANRLRELARGAGRHGSCGHGIGELQADIIKDATVAIRAKELLSPQRLASRLAESRQAKYDQLRREVEVPDGAAAAREWSVFTNPDLIPWLCDEYAWWTKLVQIVPGTEHLANLAARHELLVFEGAQGVLLDERYGFHPYTTWSTTTPANARTLLAEIGYDEPVTCLGVMRAYATRHGPGPFVTEDPDLTEPLREYHNDTGPWQGSFRYGHLDLVAHQYALAVSNGLDELAVTGLDRLPTDAPWRFCTGYRFDDVSVNLARYMVLRSQGEAAAIRPKQGSKDLDYQSRLTDLMFACSPVYRAITPAGTPDLQDRYRELLHTIEEFLGLPISITSHGPTAADKRVLVTL